MKTLKWITTLALLHLSLVVSAQEKHLTDSMRREVNKATTDTGRVATRLRIAYYYLDVSNDIGNLDSAERYLEQANKSNRKHVTPQLQNLTNLCYALLYCYRKPDSDPKKSLLPVIAACSKTGDKENEMSAWDYLAYFTKRSTASNPFKLTCYEKGMALARQLGDGNSEMFALIEIADIYSSQKQYSLAETDLFQVIKEAKKAGSKNVMVSYDLLAEIYILKAEYDKALYYEIKYLKSAESTKDTPTAAAAYARLANISFYLGNYSSAIEWGKRSLNYLIATNEPNNIFYTVHSIVNNYLTAGRTGEGLKFLSTITAKYKPVKPQDRRYILDSFGEIYSFLKNYPLAEKSFLEMTTLFDTGANVQWNIEEVYEYEDIGNFYFRQKKYARARTYLATALNQLGKGGVAEGLSDIHYSLFRVDSALGDYRTAIFHLQQRTKFKDSLFNTARDNQVEELNIQYQTEGKEKDIKLARDKAKLEQVQLERTQNGRDWIIAGSGLLLIIVVLLYGQNRMRKKNNSIITRQNELITQKNELLQKLLTEKEWLLKEVHHRVKNNLHTVICLLESQASGCRILTWRMNRSRWGSGS